MSARATGSLARAALALAMLSSLGGSLSCMGAAAEIRLALEPADDADLSEVGALKFLVRDLGAEGPETFGPVPLEPGQPLTLSATVAPETPMYVDVWGCPDVDRCSPVDVLARGCTAVIELAEGEVRDEVVVLSNVTATSGPACPPSADGG